MKDALRQEQIEYYRARANEYEETALPHDAMDAGTHNPFAREWMEQVQAVRELPRFGKILELACGTGLWTRELVQHTEHLTALDAAPEMLELNRANVGDARVQYEQADLFHWEPRETYDLLFFAFWISHVPAADLQDFLGRVRRALRPGGQLLLIDEPLGTKNVIPTFQNTQTRTLNNGRTFTIVKEYYDPAVLRELLAGLGFGKIQVTRGEYFFRLRATNGTTHDKAN